MHSLRVRYAWPKIPEHFYGIRKNWRAERDPGQGYYDERNRNANFSGPTAANGANFWSKEPAPCVVRAQHKTMQPTPCHEGPIGTVPQASKEHDNEKI